MSNNNLAADINCNIANDLNLEQYFYSEDQARYVITTNQENLAKIKKLAEKNDVFFEEIGKVSQDFLKINEESVSISELTLLNEALFPVNYFVIF